MKPIKIEAGDLKQNLKWYMFITNEYGKPTKESIDLFIESFGKIILNGEFYLRDTKKSFDLWWAEIEKDLSERELYHLANYSGGYEWLLGLSDKSKSKTLTSEDELRQYILESEVPDSMAKYDLDFSITPDLIKTDENGKNYIECVFHSKGHYSDLHLYEDCTTVVLAGAYIEDLKPCSIDDKSIIKHREKYKDIIDSNELSDDASFKTPSGAITFIYGSCLNGWWEVRNRDNQRIDIYRQPKKVETVVAPKSEPKQLVKNEAETLEQKLHKKLSKYFHKDIADWAKLDDILTLVGKNKYGDVVEQLNLNVQTGEVEVIISQLPTLNGNKFNSFEDYLIKFYLTGFNNDTVKVKEHFGIMCNDIKDGKVWSVQFGRRNKPLNVIFIWESV